MKVQRLLITSLAALVLLLVVAQVDSYAKLNGDVNDAIRQGKRVYAQPVSDAGSPFEKPEFRGDYVLPIGKRFYSDLVPEYFVKLIEATYFGYRDFKDYIRIPRSDKFKDAEVASFKYVKLLVVE